MDGVKIMANIAIFLAEGFEEIEGLMVVDLLRRAGITVDMVSISDSLTVTGSHKITVTADKLLKDIDFDSYELLVLPGGMPGTIHLGECEELCDALVKACESDKKIAAICAAPTVFGKLGLLKGKKACCYPDMEDGLVGAEVSYQPVTVDGNITTSRGLGTALPFALSLIEQLLDKETSDELAEKVVYTK